MELSELSILLSDEHNFVAVLDTIATTQSLEKWNTSWRMMEYFLVWKNDSFRTVNF